MFDFEVEPCDPYTIDQSYNLLQDLEVCDRGSTNHGSRSLCLKLIQRNKKNAIYSIVEQSYHMCVWSSKHYSKNQN